MNPADFPLILNVSDIQQILRVGRVKAYEITKRKDFPAIKDGNRILIPRDAFFRWVEAVATSDKTLAVR